MSGNSPQILYYAMGVLLVLSSLRTDFPMDINERDQTIVLGMNFLTSFSGWQIEGNYLVLRP